MFCGLAKVKSKRLRMKPFVVNHITTEYYPRRINIKYSLLTGYPQVYKHNSCYCHWILHILNENNFFD